MKDLVKAYPFYVLPHHFLSRIVYFLTRRQSRWVVPFIKLFSKKFNVNLTEAAEQDLGNFATFNAFFTRELKADARPIDDTEEVLVSPVDGTVSECGAIKNGSIFQAKGHEYSLLTLLGDDEALADLFRNGQFSTIYLSPRDYHRIHMPCRGTLTHQIHVPGRLFSVAPFTVNTIPSVFARNERVVTVYKTDFGPMAMILVGAMNVAAIETVWDGLITPPKGKTVSTKLFDEHPITLKKGEEMGRFNMGSTVIWLMSNAALKWINDPKNGDAVRLGEGFMALQTPSVADTDSAQ